MNIEEIWKPVVGYEGLYEVSNFGRIMSMTPFGGPRLKAQNKNTTGYYQVGLCKKNVLKRWCVHRVVAQAFIQNPNNLPEVNHRDGNKQNNVANNLEWMTKADNLRHSWKLGLHVSPRGENARHAKLKAFQIEEIKAHIAENKLSLCAIGRLYGITGTHVARIRDNVHYRQINKTPDL